MKKTSPHTLRKRWYQHAAASLSLATATGPRVDGARAVAATSAAFALLFLVSLVILYSRPARTPPASILLSVVPATQLPATAVSALHPPLNETAAPPAPNVTAEAASPAAAAAGLLPLYNNAGNTTTAQAPLGPSTSPNPPPSVTRPSTPTGNPSPPSASCDMSKGEWVYDPDGVPSYTNTTCWTIQEHQNCIKFGRPDTDYLKWRWKPDGAGCGGMLPQFDPAAFLDLVRGKSMAFVGDSLARNQMQSLMCLLSRVEYPEDVSETRDVNFKRMHYASHNFTVSIFWSPFLVRAEEARLPEHNWTGLWNLHLDEVDERWASRAREFDYMVISGGNWFTRPAMFTVNNTIVGSNYYLRSNISTLSIYYGNKMAFETAFRAVATRDEFRGVTTVLRTVSPAHFENGEWNTGGDCRRTRPYGRGEARVGLLEDTMYRDQLKAFKEARRMGRSKRMDLRLLDATQAMLLRPDGHPSRYGHLQGAAVAMPNDCVHWCLPGPVDMWNDLLLYVLQM